MFYKSFFLALLLSLNPLFCKQNITTNVCEIYQRLVEEAICQIPAPSEYDRHLPEEIYKFFEEHLEAHEDNSRILITRQIGENEAVLSMCVDWWVRTFVVMEYMPAVVEDNFSRVVAFFHLGRLAGYMVFDKRGRDYVPASLPLSKKDDEAMTSFLMNEVFPIFKKEE